MRISAKCGCCQASHGMFERSPFSYRADPLVPAFPDDKPIFFFDGVCGLCTGFAEFILRHDRRGVFRIATVQSPLGQALLAHYGLPTDDFTTNLLLADGRPRLKSDAFIDTMTRLPAPWPLFALMRISPRGFRDWAYTPIARNRYRWFGRRMTCRIPAAGETDRFI
jgi:predicted DCC family thiol-disulfide oxidoreductase YuxK